MTDHALSIYVIIVLLALIGLCTWMQILTNRSRRRFEELILKIQQQTHDYMGMDGDGECDHEWEVTDEGGGGSEFQPPDPAVRHCNLCGRSEQSCS